MKKLLAVLFILGIVAIGALFFYTNFVDRTVNLPQNELQSKTPEEELIEVAKSTIEQYLNEHLATQFLPSTLNVEKRRAIRNQSQGNVYFATWKVAENDLIGTLSFNGNNKDIKKLEIGVRMPKINLDKKTALASMQKFFKAVPEEKDINCNNIGEIILCERFQTKEEGFDGIGVASPFEFESMALLFFCKIPVGSEYSFRQSCRDIEELRL